MSDPGRFYYETLNHACDEANEFYAKDTPMSDHDWRFFAEINNAHETKETFSQCRCGVVRQATEWKQQTCTYTYYVPGLGGTGTEPPCGNGLQASLNLLEAKLKAQVIASHRAHCTKDNCVLDGGPEHEEAFALPDAKKAAAWDAIANGREP